MTDDDPPRANRRDLLKGVLLGGVSNTESRRDALASLIGGSVTRDRPPDRTHPPAIATNNHVDSPVPVRATGSVSMKTIAANTGGVSGPPYRISDVATERGVLNFSHSTNPREDPPFAFRELITSQRIDNQQITNKNRGGALWHNWVRDHATGGLTKFRPDTEQELFDAILWNAREERKIRAVGAGHSHSKVAAPDQSFIELSWYPSNNTLDGLIRKHNHEWLDAGVTRSDKARVQAGATIKYLNRHLLLQDDKALYNQGSFDGQTISGAINTGTHGTGARLGSLADTVRSVEMVTVEESPAKADRPLVRKYRIEPESDPITNRRQFEDDVGDHETTLIQDDDVFHAVVVGYGVMGVAYEYTIDVRDKYFLHEDNIDAHWDQFKNDISTLIEEPNPNQPFWDVVDSSNFPAGARHFQFRVNLPQVEIGPTKKSQNPKCLLVSHREPAKYSSSSQGDPPFVPWPGPPYNWNKNHWPPERDQKSLQQMFRNLRKSGKGGFKPKKTPAFLPPGINWRFTSSKNQWAFEGNLGSYFSSNTPTPNMSASFVALRRPIENRLDAEAEPKPPPAAISTEIAVPVDQVQEAIEAVFEEVRTNEYAYNVPMGVRFVARGGHFLAPEYSSNPGNADAIAKVEVPFLVRKFTSTTLAGLIQTIIPRQQQLKHADKALHDIEQTLYDMVDQGDLDFARPHLGKTNHLSRQQLADMYPEFDTWQAIHETFDAFGTFNNGFTNDKGIDIPRP